MLISPGGLPGVSRLVPKRRDEHAVDARAPAGMQRLQLLAAANMFRRCLPTMDDESNALVGGSTTAR